MHDLEHVSVSPNSINSEASSPHIQTNATSMPYKTNLLIIQGTKFMIIVKTKLKLNFKSKLFSSFYLCFGDDFSHRDKSLMLPLRLLPFALFLLFPDSTRSL